jgi:hypothetical protein
MVFFNDAFNDLCYYLPKKRARMTRLWQRMDAVPFPKLFKDHALFNGQIYFDESVMAPFIRLWTEAGLTSLYGKSGAYTTHTAVNPEDILTNETNLDAFLTNIEKAIEACEARVDSSLDSGNALIDVLAIRDLTDMLGPVNGTFELHTLPDPKTLSGPTNSPLLRTELFARCLTLKDTKGVGTDQYIVFPVHSISDLKEKVPVPFFGQCNELYSFTFLGAPKFGELNNSSVGLTYTDTTNPKVLYGSDIVMSESQACSLYTREDSWVNLTLLYDWGSGSDILTMMDGGHMLLKNIWMPEAGFLAQSAGSGEYRFVDALPAQAYYADPEDYAENYALTIARALDIPF